MHELWDLLRHALEEGARNERAHADNRGAAQLEFQKLGIRYR
jgi:hypothetical protein